MKTSIVIVTYNHLEYTKLCIGSIRLFTRRDSYELVIVDNGSTDGTVEWLQEQPDVRAVYNKENVGFPKGCNQGMAAARWDYIMLLNNDTIVTVNWLDQLLGCLRSDARIGAVGPVTNSASYYTAIPADCTTDDELIRFAGQYNKSDPAKWEERIKLIGFCLLIKREVMAQVGVFDERFSPGNFEDDDYSLRIRLAGYKLMLCKDTFIYHFGNASFGDDMSAFVNLCAENEKKFEQKWRINPVYSTNIRYDLLAFVDRPMDKPLRVLEVGCGCGATLLQLKNAYPHAELYGIELNEHSAAVARLVAQVENQNVETVEMRYPQNFFDYVIFGDVLEHLYDPWKVLKAMTHYLKEDGSVLASIPNATHFTLIRDLMMGDWTYVDRGLLDRTHIRFFTFREICKMFREAGFESLAYSTNTGAQRDEDEAFITELCKLSDENMWDQYHVYQYLIRASKQPLASAHPDSSVRQKLKFLLRRIERDIDRAESEHAVIMMLSSGDIGYKELAYILQTDIVEKEETVRRLAEAGCTDGIAASVEQFMAHIEGAQQH